MCLFLYTRPRCQLLLLADTRANSPSASLLPVLSVSHLSWVIKSKARVASPPDLRCRLYFFIFWKREESRSGFAHFTHRVLARRWR